MPLHPPEQIAASIGERAAEGARPFLQHLYRTRMRSYREAFTEFSQGFREGFQEDGNREADARGPDDAPKGGGGGRAAPKVGAGEAGDAKRKASRERGQA